MVVRERVGKFGSAAAGAAHTTAARRPGHDAVRAKLDLPDFFKNLAGDHVLEGDEFLNFWCVAFQYSSEIRKAL